MSKRLVKNRMNYTDIMNELYPDKGRRYELITGESMTSPDEALTIQEIIDRHTRGQYVPVGELKYAETLEELELPDYSKLTKQEIISLKHENDEFIRENRRVLEKWHNYNKNKKQTQEKNEKSSSTEETS
jgi:hypothetical protein